MTDTSYYIVEVFLCSVRRVVFSESRSISVIVIGLFHGKAAFSSVTCFMAWMNGWRAFLRILNSSRKLHTVPDAVLHIMQVWLTARWFDWCLFVCKVYVPVRRWFLIPTYMMSILLHSALRQFLWITPTLSWLIITCLTNDTFCVLNFREISQQWFTTFCTLRFQICFGGVHCRRLLSSGGWVE